MTPSPVLTICEISIGWFKENPVLGIESILKFYKDHPPETWNVRMRQERTGFFDLVAARKTGDHEQRAAA